jgi:hypothetical protein
MPVEVRDASGAVASFVVPAAEAQALVGDAFEVVSFLPGRTLLFMGCIDYTDNDLGDYNEVALNFFVGKKNTTNGFPYVGNWIALARGGLPSFSWKMPVNQSFTCDAGAGIWGFPKTVERIDFDYSREASFHCLLEMGGRKVFEIRLPRGGNQTPSPMQLTAYSYIKGVPHQTAFTQRSEGVGTHFGGSGVELSLGTHPIAETLRELGLPKKPLMTMWTQKMVMTFGEPQKL